MKKTLIARLFEALYGIVTRPIGGVMTDEKWWEYCSKAKYNEFSFIKKYWYNKGLKAAKSDMYKDRSIQAMLYVFQKEYVLGWHDKQIAMGEPIPSFY